MYSDTSLESWQLVVNAAETSVFGKIQVMLLNYTPPQWRDLPVVVDCDAGRILAEEHGWLYSSHSEIKGHAQPLIELVEALLLDGARTPLV
ncbi:hypothetical protein JX266_014370 [Neoarthrinium moseri]|nr:hypothetical protein JX266_014370 [Neoarthrinium moseri]